MSVFNIVSIICFSLCLLMFFYFKWYINKRTTESGLEEYRKELKKMESDINAVTDRNLQLIEDNISKLKMVLEETDKRISVYNTEREKSRANETLYTSLGRGIRAALKTIEDPASLQQERQAEPPQQTAQTPIVQPAAVQPEPPDVKPLTKQQIRSAIDSLIMEGLSPEEIASRLDISIAEVNLAINLFRRK
ncbi:MAG: hypothetical protein FWB95_06950 [Treponema sp.]|nr:hypothetical protein [Treponema sp.]